MGSPVQFLIAALGDAGLVLCAAFFGFILMIVIPFVRRKPSAAGDRRAFHWHFMIPCLNEAPVIESTVWRLIGDFPGCHVWCIDDGSTDDTGPLLAAMAARCNRVHVITRRPPHARQGKGPALNAGWEALTRARPRHVDPANVIVGVMDGDGRLDVRCPDLVTGPKFFGDPTVGAVQIQVRVVNDRAEAGHQSADPLIVRLQDVEFQSVIGAIQTFRKHVGSAGMGGNGQFTRLSVLNQIAAEHGTPWKQSLIEDFELGVHVLLSGNRTEYCHDTFVEQQGPSSFGRLVRQRSRWGQGLMQCIRYLPKILRSPRIGNGAALELSYCLILPWAQLLGGVAVIASVVIFTAAALSAPLGPAAWARTVGWGLVPLFVIFGLGPIIVWGPVHRATAAPGLSRRRALTLGLANWPYTYVHHLAIWWAFGRLLGSRSDWKKTERELGCAAVTPAVVVSRPLPSLALAAPSSAAAGEAAVVGASANRVVGLTPAPTDDDWERAVVHHRPVQRPSRAALPSLTRHNRRPSPASVRLRQGSVVS